MRRALTGAIPAAICLILCAASASAQVHKIRSLNSCIEEFYDPGMYNYLSFKNHCAQTLTVMFVAKNGSGATGTMDLRPGASDSVGRLAGGVVPKVGMFQLYVCQAGYVAVDEDNKAVTKPQANFHCQAKTQ